MANQEYIERLKKGAEVWNQWRKKYRVMHLDLSGADLISANLSDANLSEVNLTEANLTDANLISATLRSATLRSATLRSATFRSANINSADLTGADLRSADLRSTDLRSADLSDATLRSATLRSANLTGADLRSADLRSATLRSATLRSADLRSATLRSADLSDANLSGANLSDANLSGAILWNTVFSDIDLRTTKGLLEIQHKGPSQIELYSVQLPQDGSAFHFLRGAGIPNEWIDFYLATMQQPIQYHSLFISYTIGDEALAKRLHADLQAHGVRCWFAPHNLRPGDYFREKIDQAIQMQEKLLLILSEQSVNSRWVKYEVGKAQNREVNQDRTILFPIRIDDTVMKSTNEWAVSLREERHIGDFTGWENNTRYQQQFTTLLGHLKATEVKGK